MTTAPVRLVSLGVLAAALAAPAGAQSLAARVAAAPDGSVQFTFAARAGVCGNGRTYLSTSPNSFTGSWVGSIGDAVRADPCEPGPVRVVLGRMDRTVVEVSTFVGPVASTPGATDLGRVPAREAAELLLGIAAQSEGRPSRDAILPAAIADSATVAPALIALARDGSRPRETRRSALSWLGRELDREGSGVTSAQGLRVLGDLARADDDNQQVRQQALAVLARLERGAGIPTLIELSRAGSGDAWLARQSMQTLARSGDPRARQYLRTAVSRADLTDDVRAAVIRGLGGEYATGADAALLRELYPKLDGEKSRDAVLASLAELGGSENARWLLGVARSEREPQQARRRAVQLAERAGVAPAALVKLYDEVADTQLREALLGVYAQLASRAATDKLLAVARSEPDTRLRRRAVALMSRSEDPRVKDALREIVER